MERVTSLSWHSIGHHREIRDKIINVLSTQKQAFMPSYGDIGVVHVVVLFIFWYHRFEG